MPSYAALRTLPSSTTCTPLNFSLYYLTFLCVSAATVIDTFHFDSPASQRKNFAKNKINALSLCSEAMNGSAYKRAANIGAPQIWAEYSKLKSLIHHFVMWD